MISDYVTLKTGVEADENSEIITEINYIKKKNITNLLNNSVCVCIYIYIY